jgi:hypothetical protein
VADSIGTPLKVGNERRHQFHEPPLTGTKRFFTAGENLGKHPKPPFILFFCLNDLRFIFLQQIAIQPLSNRSHFSTLPEYIQHA